MYGSNDRSNKNWEQSANQARLEFYDWIPRRIKYNVQYNDAYGMDYWSASPYSGSPASYFGQVGSGGETSRGVASAVGGCALAFCVK